MRENLGLSLTYQTSLLLLKMNLSLLFEVIEVTRCSFFLVYCRFKLKYHPEESQRRKNDHHMHIKVDLRRVPLCSGDLVL